MTVRAVFLSLALAGAAALYFAGGASLPAWAVGSQHVVTENPSRPMTAVETKKIESYMRQVFGKPEIRLVHMAPDAEVWLGEHFLGIVYPDDGKEGRTFYFEMSIFEEEASETPLAKRRR